MSGKSLKIACLPLAFASLLVCQTHDEEIRSLHRRFKRAFEHQEFGAFPGFYTSDFFCKTPNGRNVNREQFLAELNKQARSAIPPISVSFKIIKLTVDGDGATSSVSEVTSYQLKDSSGIVHHFRYTQMYVDTLARAAGRWSWRSIMYPMPSRLWLDGKRITSTEEFRRIIGK
jgi:uncharacterized protein DUF4440